MLFGNSPQLTREKIPTFILKDIHLNRKIHENLFYWSLMKQLKAKIVTRKRRSAPQMLTAHYYLLYILVEKAQYS